MKWRKAVFPAIYTFMTQESLVQSVARQHLSYFDKQFFKEKFLDNKRSMENLYKGKKFLSPHRMPSVFMAFEIEDNPQNTLEQSNFPYQSGAHWIGGPLSTFYWRIFFHRTNKISMFASFIRKKITINIRYMFTDRYMQDDFYNYLVNTFPYGGPGIKFNVTSSILAPLPNNMLEYIAVMQGYDLSDPQYAKKLGRELEEYSSGLIRRRKVVMQDKQEMYFLGFRDPYMKILHPERPEKDEGEQVGQMRTRFGITEPLVFEPHIPTMFITNIPEVINGRKTPGEYKPRVFGGYDIDPRRFFTRNMNIDPKPRTVPVNTEISITQTFFSVSNNSDPEVINIDDSFISKEDLKVIETIKRRVYKPIESSPGSESGETPQDPIPDKEAVRGDPSEAYIVRLWAFDTQLREGTDYKMDWDTMRLTILNTNIEYSYKLQISKNADIVKPYLDNLRVHSETEPAEEEHVKARVFFNGASLGDPK
jgi:hypothetical protein